MQRNEAIDRLRGLAIILVLGLHFFDLLLYIKSAATHDQPYAYRIFNHGYFGVIIFFVLSGFLIASTSIADDGDRLSVDRSKFYIRRATRIFPLLFLVILFGALMLSTRDMTRAEPLARAFQYLFAVPGAEFTSGFWASIAGFCFNWFRVLSDGPTHGWFGLQWDVLWSLAVEEQFYVVFPWVILLCKTKRRVLIFMTAVTFACVTGRLFLMSVGSPTLSAFANSIICFDALALGVIVSLLNLWDERRSRAAVMLGGALLAFSYICGSSAMAGLPTFLIALSTAAIIQGAKNFKFHSFLAAEPIMPAFGKLSYGLYLLHPIIFFSVSSIILKLNPLVAFSAALAVAFLVATLSFRLYEAPIERLLRNRLFKIIYSRRNLNDVARAKVLT